MLFFLLFEIIIANINYKCMILCSIDFTALNGVYFSRYVVFLLYSQLINFLCNVIGERFSSYFYDRKMLNFS